MICAVIVFGYTGFFILFLLSHCRKNTESPRYSWLKNSFALLLSWVNLCLSQTPCSWVKLTSSGWKFFLATISFAMKVKKNSFWTISSIKFYSQPKSNSYTGLVELFIKLIFSTLFSARDWIICNLVVCFEFVSLCTHNSIR